ncbi:MAG TPA: hypothetical protein VGD67_08225 [Pseudonocardiaceae bacterium]
MTKNRRLKNQIRALQKSTGTSYMVARRELAGGVSGSAPTGDDGRPPMALRPPLAVWERPSMCRFWEDLQEGHGPLIALKISLTGGGWWGLDDLAREVAGALQDDRPANQRGLWLGVGRYNVTKQEHLAGIVAALDGAGAVHRLTVRSMPDGANCTHASCRRRRGQPPVSAQGRPDRGAPVPIARAGIHLPVTGLSLREVMDVHPQLNSHGFGVFNGQGMTAEQRREKLSQGRDELRSSEGLVLRVRDWLRVSIAPIKTPTVGSYGMKHVVEKAIGQYITNGELITAALMAGYPMGRPHGPNVDFGMSKRDVDRARTANRRN